MFGRWCRWRRGGWRGTAARRRRPHKELERFEFADDLSRWKLVEAVGERAKLSGEVGHRSGRSIVDILNQVGLLRGGAASLPRPRPEGPASTTTPITVAPPAGARASPTPPVAPHPGTQVPAGPHAAAGTV